MRGLAIAAALLLAGCVVYGGLRVEAAMVVYEEPPPPKLERTPPLPLGLVWVGGHWESHDNQWMWIAGRVQPVRAGYAWSDGHWERRGNAWHWVEGVWIASGAVAQPSAP